MKKLNSFQEFKKYYMELTEDEIIEKYAKLCGNYNRNTILPYEYEFTCISCGYNVIKRKHEFTKIQ